MHFDLSLDVFSSPKHWRMQISKTYCCLWLSVSNQIIRTRALNLTLGGGWLHHSRCVKKNRVTTVPTSHKRTWIHLQNLAIHLGFTIWNVDGIVTWVWPELFLLTIKCVSLKKVTWKWGETHCDMTRAKLNEFPEPKSLKSVLLFYSGLTTKHSLKTTTVLWELLSIYILHIIRITNLYNLNFGKWRQKETLLIRIACYIKQFCFPYSWSWCNCGLWNEFCWSWSALKN